MKHDVFTGRDSKEKVLSHSLSSAQTILYTLCGLLITFIIWAKFFSLNEMARTTQARISPSSKTQYIQSLDGGILKTLYTQEGKIVDKGELLAEIDASESSLLKFKLFVFSLRQQGKISLFPKNSMSNHHLQQKVNSSFMSNAKRNLN